MNQIQVTAPQASSQKSRPIVIKRRHWAWGRVAWRSLTLSLRRYFWSSQTCVNMLLTLLCVLIEWGWVARREREVQQLVTRMLVPLHLSFLMPIYALSYGATAIAGEREDRTLIYSLLSTAPRGLIYLAKWGACCLLTSLWTLGSLALLCLISGDSGQNAWKLLWAPVSLGCLVYVTVFMLLGTIFRAGALVSLVYWFFLEVMFGNMPGLIKRVSISYYLKCWIYDWGKAWNLGPQSAVERSIFHPIPGLTAIGTVVTLGIVALVVGSLVFSRRDYPELH